MFNFSRNRAKIRLYAQCYNFDKKCLFKRAFFYPLNALSGPDVAGLEQDSFAIEVVTLGMPELDPRYDPKEIESRTYELWERSGYFNPDNLPIKSGAKTYTIIMPPPNANGALHMGHAVFVTLEDIMTRYWRMQGKKTLWLPGADHAGFETQVVFDKKLEKEGRNRFHIDRETLWKEMWEFTQTNKKVMEAQMRRLGASCDWSRETFTLDPKVIEQVYATFKKLHKDGFIYRDLRVVNWCPKHKTALSDLEVKYMERKDPLYYIKYGPLTLATVRPETKFGDTALAVNPKDKRYFKYIGKELEVQGVLGPVRLRVIEDEAVDADFGTGVVKITPAHDPLDFEIWQRHKDEIPGPKIIIDEGGRLTGETGRFKGLKVQEARAKIAEAMQEMGILEKVDPEYVHQVATCYKCGSVLEPLPRAQWFMKMRGLADEAVKAVKKNKIKFHPESSRKVFFHWLENIRDWNISRQIVWGIRIPAWFCLSCGNERISPQARASWYFVRHGEIDKIGHQSIGQMDVPLNAEGRKQAEQAAEQFRGKKIDLIVSSDLSRTRQTAEAIARATGAKIVFEKDLRERHLGISQGMSKEERDRMYGEEIYSYTGKPPGGESFEEVDRRAIKVLERYEKSHLDKNVIFVSHGGPLRLIMKHFRNEDPGALDKTPRRDAMLQGEPQVGEVIQLDILEPCLKCKGAFYEQDPDVFDTWFSSGQWPYITLGYPDGKDLKEFYPTDVMETGYDILFFWVARMIMFGLYRTGEVPFRDVYLHGLVRDKDRQKMSKSKGNVMDPLGVADTYGTDAVRMALVVGNTAGQDAVISEDKIRGYRNFATKLWNITRFILMNREKAYSQKAKLTQADKKLVDTARKVKIEVGKHIEKFEFHLAAEKAYHYVWHTFADEIIEAAKPRLQSDRAETRASAYATLEDILLESLTMLHPFMPFVTEELYQKVQTPAEGGGKGSLLLVKEW